MNKELFISYSTKDNIFAKSLVETIENDGEYKCFYAPRDIKSGEYARQIVEAIERAYSIVLIFSKSSNDSVYVLRELNSAVLRGVPIIPYCIDDIKPSKSMEFYLGVVQFLDAYKMTKEDSYHALKSWLIESSKQQSTNTSSKYKCNYPDYAILGDHELRKIGYDVSRIVMETIEIDYITLDENEGDYFLNEEIEGTFDDWVKHVKTYPDIFSLLVKDNKAIGYYQYELLNKSNYHKVIAGKTMVNPKMMEFYGFGGEFYLYVVMFSVLKEHENMRTVMMLWDRLFRNIEDHIKSGIIIPVISISVYSDFIKIIAQKMGFIHVNTNLANGDIYELDLANVKVNNAIKNRYPALYSILTEQK